MTLKGSKECIELAIARIKEIVHELDSQVTIECVIPQRHHRTVMGSRGVKVHSTLREFVLCINVSHSCKYFVQVQGITSEFDVHIKFPDRSATEGVNEINGGEPNTNGEEVRQCDIIRITGLPEKCEAAKQALIDQIPITEEINVPFDIHRWIIGQKGRDVRELMSRYDVHIELSPPEEKLDIIKITGTPVSIEDAKKAIEVRVEEYEVGRKDRELRSFELKLEIDPIWHSKIIGRRGAVINKIRANHGVQISFPRKEDEADNIITIQGYEDAANAAKDEILKIYNELNELVREQVEIDYRVHARIIGQRGRNIHKIMEEYKVEIRFPKQGEENMNAITIIGSAEAVSETKDHLLNLEEEFLEDIADAPTSTSDFSSVIDSALKKNGIEAPASNANAGKKEGFVVKGAPWTKSNAAKPNAQSQEDFPAFGLGSGNTNTTPFTSAWGQRR